MDREGVSFINSLINTWKGLQLDMEHSDILSEMCEVEHRKKMKRMEADTLPELKRVSQELRLRYRDLVPIVSRFESLAGSGCRAAAATAEQPGAWGYQGCFEGVSG